MKNFGFHELVLLNPCEVDTPARVMSMHAYDEEQDNPMMSIKKIEEM
jgi:tRNA C32,U32 (ribose-2'-O)-methylase TrmJ